MMDYSGIAWPEACFNDTEPQHFFIIGDWGGTFPHTTFNNRHGIPEQPQIDPFAQLTLTFDIPQGITADQATHACPGGFHEPTSAEIRAGGGIEYCWDKSGTLSFCPHGCFIYNVEQMEGTGYLAFPLMESTAHLAPAHYAPTDQQGAEVASMITGVLAATNPPTEEEDYAAAIKDKSAKEQVIFWLNQMKKKYKDEYIRDQISNATHIE